MKTIKLLSIAVILLLTSSTSVLKANAMVGESNTSFGKYLSGSALTKMVVDGKTVDTYVIYFDNFDQPVQVGVVNESDCRYYVVRGNNFEALYGCDKEGFGVKKMVRKYSVKNKNFVSLNTENFQYQKKIETKHLPVSDAISYIACYLPELLK